MRREGTLEMHGVVGGGVKVRHVERARELGHRRRLELDKWVSCKSDFQFRLTGAGCGGDECEIVACLSRLHNEEGGFELSFNCKRAEQQRANDPRTLLAFVHAFVLSLRRDDAPLPPCQPVSRGAAVGFSVIRLDSDAIDQP